MTMFLFYQRNTLKENILQTLESSEEESEYTIQGLQ